MPVDKLLFHENDGLIRILQIIMDAPSGRITTRNLLETIGSHKYHIQLQKGQRLGLIKRESLPMPRGEKGADRIVNSLTPRGEILLDIANQYRRLQNKKK